jgi:glucose/arabinose dehydrogenase
MMTMTSIVPGKLLPLILMGLLAAAPSFAQDVVPSAHHDYRVATVADGLEHPWAIAFLPEGDILVTERPGRLRIVRDGTLLPNAVPGVPAVRAEGQGGLLDVVLHPDFASNRLLYLSFSKPNADGSESTTAVVRGRFENDELLDVEEIFEAQVWSEGRGHYGSRLAFDRDGYLFITVGDRQVDPSENQESHPAQLLTSHHGKVVRLHDDGTVPTDNPFADQSDALPEIWSYGHRNPQGLAIHPESNDVWVTEHGPQGGDELNLVQPGANYGWPVVGYGVNYGSGAALHRGTMGTGMEDPVRFWVPSIGASGLIVYTGDQFPSWQGNLLAGGLALQQIARLTMDGREVTAEETILRDVGRVRDLRQGPDGYIYVAIDDRQGGATPIVRLEPASAQ